MWRDDSTHMCKKTTGSSFWSVRPEIWIVQQDNDSNHSSKFTTYRLYKKRIEVLQWPSQNPDLIKMPCSWTWRQQCTNEYLKKLTKPALQKMTWENDEVSCQVYALYCAILQIVILIWYQVNRGLLLSIPMPILMLLTYKGSICSGQQCVMIYERFTFHSNQVAQ